MENSQGGVSEFPGFVLPVACHEAMFKKVVDCEVEREAAKQLLRSLVYSKNEDEYQRLKQQVFTETNEDFKEYFIKSWDDCQEMWVTYKKAFIFTSWEHY